MRWPFLFAALLLGACAGDQSALDPSGPEARRVALLFWIMTVGGGAILALVTALTLLAIVGPARVKATLSTERVVFAGGVVFPIVALTVLLAYGFVELSAGAKMLGAQPPLRITVIGERWWWRVYYEGADGARLESANELRIPVGKPVEIRLESADVIHSFWAPSYAGKVDMVPGRTNILRLQADKPGLVRGQCTEYCGGAHSLMAFYVVAMPEAEFEAWRARESRPAIPSEETRGAALFRSAGCGACHSVRGTAAQGRIGPDLTHVASRHSLGAATLPNDTASFERWITSHRDIKPDNLMPPFEIFSPDEVRSIARYLASLE